MKRSDMISRKAACRAMMDKGKEKLRLSTVINELEMLPGIEAVPVVHGQWADREGPDEDGNISEWCSNCGHSDTHSPTVKVPFCWFCGAKMDGKERDYD